MLSLAALTGELIDFATVAVVVPPPKLEKYLLVNEDKLKLMTSIGRQDVDTD